MQPDKYTKWVMRLIKSHDSILVGHVPSDPKVIHFLIASRGGISQICQGPSSV